MFLYRRKENQTEKMQWKALLYSKEIADKEKTLNSFLQEIQHSICCIGINPDNDPEHLKEQIKAKLEKTQVVAEDCLYILEEREEWEAAQALGMAVLPYVPAGKMQPDCFSDAWIVVEGFEDLDMDFFQKAYERAHNLPWTMLETKRCVIREFSMEDLPALFELYAQPSVTEFMEPLFEWEKEKEYQEAYISNVYRYYGYGMWLVCKKDTGQIIGRAGFEHREYEDETELEMGYLIASSEQRKGYATEVCRALIDYAEKNLDFPSINCLIQKENKASIHLAEGLGFEFAGETDISGKPMLRYTKYCFFKTNKI